MRSAILLCFLPILAAASDAATTVEVDVEGLRNHRGLIHVCLTRNPDHFPDCRRDPRAVRGSAAATDTHLRFTGLAPGRYAVTLFHDENANQRLDKLMGIPREGFGFSRNPVIRFGAPRFETVGIELGGGFTRTQVRVQYLL